MNAKQLRQLLVDSIELEDLVLAKAALNTLDQGYQEAGIDTPEWVTDQMGIVIDEITYRNKTELQKRLKAAKSRRAALATADEKRSRLDEQIAELEKKLG